MNKFKTAPKYLAILLLAFSGSANAVSGNEYRAFSESERLMWVAGAIDGILTAQLVMTNEQPQLVVCLAELEVPQIKAIFERELERTPERWHFPAAFGLLSRLNNYCGIS